MKITLRSFSVILAMLLIALPLLAQRSSPNAGSRSGRTASGTGSSSSVSGAYVNTGSSSVSRSAPGSYSRSSGYSSSSYGVSPGYVYGGGSFAPNIQGTSFSSLGCYYDWNNYYYYLLTHYRMNSLYFGRFYRNREPLVTPTMLKLTMREPIQLSAQMLDSIDQLESMLKDAQSGKPFDKEALVDKSKEIRDLAKKIRKNHTISLIDLRDDTKVYEEDDAADVLSPQSLNKLHEMAIDLNRQLKNAYNQNSTSTVSVDYYNQPSFESLAKGIEKLSKAIEKSSKRM